MVSTSTLLGLLTLFFIHSQHYSAQSAYHKSASFAALMFISALLGGFCGGRYLKHEHSIMLGLVLSATAMLSLGLTILPPPISLAIFVTGVGLSTPNIYFLLGQCYSSKTDSRRNSGFTTIYVYTNIGALFGFFFAGVLSQTIGFSAAFLLGSVSNITALLLLFF